MENIDRALFVELAAPPIVIFLDRDAFSDEPRSFGFHSDASIAGLGATTEHD